jgi:hypothetical protein
MNRKSRFLLVFFLLVCSTTTLLRATSARAGEKQKPATACELSDEDYAVFTAVLQGLGRPEDPEEEWKDKETLVVDVTGAGLLEPGQGSGWGFRSNSKAAPSAETRSDFDAKSKNECPLKENWGDTTLYKTFPHNEYRQLFDRKRLKKHDGWKEFYEKHPKAAGFWTFSRPGYNSDRDEALLYVAHNCGWLCGTGHLYLLAKKNGQWKVINRLFLWIS